MKPTPRPRKPTKPVAVWLGMNPPPERPRQFRQFGGCEAAVTPRDRKPGPR